jgi:Spy/CpxP family protein refolding chaperone
MLILKIALGVFLGGLFLARFLVHAVWRRRHGWGGRGWSGRGWGGCGWGGHGWGGGRSWRHGWHLGGGPGHWFRIYRSLDLDAAQKDEVRTLWLDVRQAFGAVRYDGMRTMSDVIDVALAEPLDPARLEQLAGRHADAHAQLARKVAEAVTRLHQTLRPEQRDRLREALGRRSATPGAGGPGSGSGGGGSDDGPYR